MLEISWTLEWQGRTKEIESEYQLWKVSLVTCGKQFPSEALVSYCLNFFYSFKTGQSTNTGVTELAIGRTGTQGLWHSSLLWVVSWLEHAAESHTFSRQYYHLSFPSSGKEVRGQYGSSDLNPT